MNTLTDREKWDIGKMVENSHHYSSISERHRTEAVSMAAVLASGHNLEYVPEAILNKNICRAALNSKDVDCTVLPYIPYPDVQKEGIQKFSGAIPAFVLYSFADITDTKMAQDAVKADAYCLQLVPDKLMTISLCKLALQNSDADKKVLEFIPERFHHNPDVRKLTEERFGNSTAQKEIPQPEKKKGRSIG